MSKISKASQYVCAILVIMASLQLITHILLVLFSEQSQGVNQLNVHTEIFYGLISHEVTQSWQNIAQALEAEGFSSLLILGTAELVPYLVIYFFLFQLFSLYQQGQVFTLANSHCFKSIAKTLLAWAALNLFYPVVVTLVIRLTGFSDSLSLYFSVGSREFIYLLSGLILYVMAWVMSDASAMQQEQELVI